MAQLFLFPRTRAVVSACVLAFAGVFAPLISGAGVANGFAQEASAKSLAPTRAQTLPPWTEGYLYIHHISTGRGNAAYIVMRAKRIRSS
jgi:hypothetical protein